jgi:hypothetical protein
MMKTDKVALFVVAVLCMTSMGSALAEPASDEASIGSDVYDSEVLEKSKVLLSSPFNAMEAEISILPDNASVEVGDELNFQTRITSLKILTIELVRVWGPILGFGWDWGVLINNLIRFETEYRSTDPTVLQIDADGKARAVGGGNCSVIVSFSIAQSKSIWDNIFRFIFRIDENTTFTAQTEVGVEGGEFVGPISTRIVEVRAAGIYGENITLAARLVDAGNNPMVGEELIFKTNASEKVGITGPSGIAEVEVPALEAPGDYPYSVSFLGDGAYDGSNLTSSYRVEKIPTHIKVDAHWDSGVLWIGATLSPSLEGRELFLYYYNEKVGGWVYLASGRTDCNGGIEIQVDFDKPEGSYYIGVEFLGDELHAASWGTTIVRIG